uniref:LAGLIDADG endonuclease n=1 Tax=Chrysoporthe austroafricana TaxID=354353 RepID=A0A191MWY2_9PEZI|nr:LAGLIDADG endonuclease [Chrysoporthe austroafricana]AMX22114.1 LAGLIDADG endonuclease [Chrysoporthe austroafricana]
MNIFIQKFTNLLRRSRTFFRRSRILKRCIMVFYLLCAQWSKLFKEVPLPTSKSFGRVGQGLMGVSSSRKPAYLVNAARIHNRKYSTAKVINSRNNLDASLSEFYQWFVGFSDGESSFQIQVRYTDASKTIVRGINFSFTIALHVDDLAILQFIKDKLGIGNIVVKRSGDVCVFTVTNKEGLYELLSIFDKYNLNTTKYLDYQDFRKAFLLYHERDVKEYNKDKNKIKDQIVELKNGMNSQRTFFDMFRVSPRGNKLAITKSWLLGFIEAEGSFFISRTDIEPSFSIELSKTQLFLLEAIKEFLIDSLGFDKYSIHRLKSSTFNIFAVNEQKEKPSVIFIVKNIRVLNNYLVPYFNTMVFNSKKGKDFLDWKLICEAVYKGSHKKESIRALILRLSYTMNSYRLSTNLAKGSIESLTEIERNTVREALPTIEHLEDGRLRDVETGQVTINRSLCVYEVIRPDGEILILDSFNDVLNILGVGFRTLKRHVNEDTLGDATEFRGYIIRRVAVFLE